MYGFYFTYWVNLQGDVTGILDNDGNLVVSYTYDAWGKPLSTSGTMASTLGQENLLRYRGYVYDADTGLYYLQSRYYNPEVGRFINADAFVSTGQGVLGNNMFAYCLNNPVIYSDYSGALCRAVACYYDGGGGRSPEYIYSQTLPEYSRIKLGWSTIGHGGCGLVAVYNAMQMLGETDTTLEEIIKYYEDNDALLLGGLLGSLPQTAVEYLRSQGYSVFVTHDIANYGQYASSVDACILWYAYMDSKKFGAHFIAFQDVGNSLSIYNLFIDQRNAYSYTGGIYDFIIWQEAIFPTLILISK